MKMKKILILLAVLFSFTYASQPVPKATGCILVQPGDVNVTWKAYKTLGKLGVGGKFTSVKYTPASKEGKNFRELFVGSTVEIDVSKIDTGNPSRDETLVKDFFSMLKGKMIEGKIVDIKSDKHVRGKPRTGVMDAKITMNGKTLTIPMRFHYHKGLLDVTGTIDLLDFAANDALASINKSCFDLHKGKTWSDVSIGFATTIEAKLCNVDLTKRKK